MRRVLLRAGLVLGAVAVLAILSAFYVVPESRQALVTRFGRPIAVARTPGLHVKLPFVDAVTLYDMRLLAMEPATELVILGDQKRVEVTIYTVFRITDPLRFNQSLQTVAQARSQLTQNVGSSLRRVMGQVMLPDLLSPKRDAIIGEVVRSVSDATRALGIEVVDVRIRRADLPPATSQAIYDRMISERQREAKELRAQGFEWAQEIKAKADRDRTVILADAGLRGRILRSSGDAAASQVLEDAFGKDTKFFAFYRAMQSYRQSLAAASPTLVLSPKSEMLRYFDAGAPTP